MINIKSLSSVIAGGNFTDVLRQGLITTGLNALAHGLFAQKDPPGEKGKKSKVDKNKFKIETPNLTAKQEVELGANIGTQGSKIWVDKMMKDAPNDFSKWFKTSMKGADYLGKAFGAYSAYDSFLNYQIKPTTAGLLKFFFDSGSIFAGPWTGLGLTLLDAGGFSQGFYNYSAYQIDQSCQCNYGLRVYNSFSTQFNNGIR